VIHRRCASLRHLARPVIAALSILATLSVAGVEAQAGVEPQSLVWMGYLVTAPIGERWSFLGELHDRRWFEPFRVHQEAVRIQFSRQVADGWTVGVGVANFYQGTQFPDSAQQRLARELRPHVQVEGRSQRHAGFQLGSRTRVEHRMFSRNERGRSVDRFVHAARFRQMVSAERAAPRPLPAGSSLRVSNEAMWMLGDRPWEKAFDQNRVQATVVVPITERLRIETAYMWLWQVRRRGGVFDRDVLRVNVLHRLGAP
jgi:hypothetical protein